MEIVILILAGILILILSSLPCLIIWLCAYLWMPDGYKSPPYKMTLISLLLSFLTGAALNLELEGGAASGIVAMLAFSVMWAMLLIPCISFVKYLKGRKINEISS